MKKKLVNMRCIVNACAKRTMNARYFSRTHSVSNGNGGKILVTNMKLKYNIIYFHAKQTSVNKPTCNRLERVRWGFTAGAGERRYFSVLSIEKAFVFRFGSGGQFIVPSSFVFKKLISCLLKCVHTTVHWLWVHWEMCALKHSSLTGGCYTHYQG